MGSQPSIPVVKIPRDRVAIVTGASSGIGYETAKFLAMMGANVIMACRDEERTKEAIKRMDAEFQREKNLESKNIMQDSHLRVEFMKLDLGSLQSTQEFIEAFKATGKKLHILICNAGIYSHHRVMTEDNFDLTYQVNFLGHFLIIANFLNIMMMSGGDCRIVMLSSQAHHDAKFDKDLASSGKTVNYEPYQCYANTKLFQIMQMYCVDKILKKSDVEICCVHPGIVDTELYRNHLPEGRAGCKRFCINCWGCVKTPQHGAASTLYAAVVPELKGISRAYYTNSRSAPSWPSTNARDEDLQELVWQSARDLLKDYINPQVDKLLSQGSNEKN